MKTLAVRSQVSGAQFAIASICREIDVSGLINNALEWDRTQWKVSPGDLITALIINILCQRTALWRVEKFFKAADPGALLSPGVAAEDFNDDALGRVLDRLYKASPKKVFTQLALQAITKHAVKVKTIHADTTSISVWGAYDGTPEGALRMACGYSKDHRPDLKQFLCGLLVSSEGVPLTADVLDGDKSERLWNKEVLEKVKKLLEGKVRDFIYVADAAMVTKKNLKVIHSKNLAFVSRLPSTFAIADRLKEQAWA